MRLAVFRLRQILRFAAAFALLAHSGLFADISFSDFSSTSGLTLNGVAAAGPGNVLRVTATTTFGQYGSAWFTTPQLVEFGFDTTFQFRLTPGATYPGEGGQGESGDGFTFTIQNSGVNAFGGAGEGIGYAGMPNSVTVEFDTFMNGPGGFDQGNNVNDPSGNHLSVHTGGDIREGFSLGSTTSIPTLNDAQVHTARILYLPGTLNIFMDDANTLRLSVPLNLSTTLSLTDGTAFLGFTAGTGAATQDHDILNWEATSVPEPSVLFMVGLGIIPLALGARRSRRRN